MKRTAIITGASRGIGRAVAINLATKGFSLVLVYKSSHDKIKELEKEIYGKCEFISVCADVSKPSEVQKVFDIAKAKFGFVDTLINNAGISHIGFFDSETQEDYDAVMDANFRSVFTACVIASKDMISHKFGRIVNVSSVWGQKGASMEVLYSASKHAVIGLTRSLNAELSPSGILVNAVCPGVIDTDMNKHFSAEDRRLIENDIPLGRFGKAEEVASVISMLTDENLYIGGEDISITAGY
jgi:3-oxoacyl-[acyl-carrier protein] reductase